MIDKFWDKQLQDGPQLISFACNWSLLVKLNTAQMNKWINKIILIYLFAEMPLLETLMDKLFPSHLIFDWFIYGNS